MNGGGRRALYLILYTAFVVSLILYVEVFSVPFVEGR